MIIFYQLFLLNEHSDHLNLRKSFFNQIHCLVITRVIIIRIGHLVSPAAKIAEFISLINLTYFSKIFLSYTYLSSKL